MHNVTEIRNNAISLTVLQQLQQKYVKNTYSRRVHFMCISFHKFSIVYRCHNTDIRL